MFFAEFQADVAVARSASVYFDPWITQIARITPVPSADHVTVSVRSLTRRNKLCISRGKDATGRRGSHYRLSGNRSNISLCL